MTRIAPPQLAFAAGEISPLLWGRSDYVRHRSGLKKCRGFIPLPEGVATRAPGTRYMGRVLDDGPVRLIGFAFRNDDTYMLEFTPLRMRVWRLGALVTVDGDPYELVTPYGADSLPRLQAVQRADRVYFVDGLQFPQRLSRMDHDDWTIEPTPFVNGPFGEQNFDEDVTIQSSGTTGVIDGFVTLTGVGGPFGDMEVGQYLRIEALDRTAEPTWTGNTAAAAGQRMIYDGRTYQIVSFDGSGDDTGVNPPTHSEGDALASKDGPIWRYLHSGFGIVRLLTIASANSATAVVTRQLPNDVVEQATWRWQRPAWGAAVGWPRAIADFEQRLIYGGAPGAPRTIWASAIGDPLDFERGVEADDSFSFDLAARRDRQNEVRWIEEGASGLHVVTSGGHVTARPTDSGVGIGPTTTAFLRGGGDGGAAVLPAVVDGEPVYLAASRRKLQGLRYALEDDSVRAQELSQNARHILAPSAGALAWQQEPWRLMWFMLDNGELAGLTLYAEQEVFAFHRHSLCGGAVKSLAVKPTDDGASEELWLAVERVVEGDTRVFVERMQPIFFDSELEAPDASDAWHQCAAIRYAGAPVASVAGLDHLEGEAVVAWTENGAQSGVVTDGVLALDHPSASAIVGLCPAGSQVLRTLAISPQGPDGGQDGRPRRVRAVGARLLHTADGDMRAIGVDSGGRESVDATVSLARRGADAFTPVNLWSGVADYKPGSGWSEEIELEFRPAPGAPLTLVAITPTMTIGDG